MKTMSIFTLLFVSILMIGCGGGSDETTTPPTPPANAAPTVDAGTDQSVSEEVLVTLSGSGADSDGSISSYQWSQTTGTTVSMSDSASASATFIAPSIIEAITLAFELTKADDGGSTAKDIIEIVVNPINDPPMADAGIDQLVNELETVTLTAVNKADTHLKK
jgi:hypothetical protein